MEEQWHLLRSGRQSGPHLLADLRRLLASTNPEEEQILVWTERITEWTDPRAVPGLMEASPVGGPAPAERAISTSPARQDHAWLNPYETPASALAPESASAPAKTDQAGPLGNHELEVGLCLQTGWRLTTARFGKLVLFGLAYLGVVMLLAAPLGILESQFGLNEENPDFTPTAFLVTFGSQLLQNVVSVFLGVGATLFGLGMVRRTDPSIGLLFAGGPHFLRVFAGAIVVGLSVLAGLLLLILPGIYIAVRMSQFQFAIVDRNLGPIDGIKASWTMTKGNFWNLFLLGLASVGIVVLGMIALGVGLLWAYPTVMLAAVAAYLCMGLGAGALANAPK